MESDFDYVFQPALIELRLFEDYLRTLEEFLTAEAKGHIESLESLRASGQLTFLDDWPPPEEEYDRYYLELIEQFTDILRKSFFTNLYSFLEVQLIEECRSRKGKDTLLNFSDIAGRSEIDKAKTYFTKVLRTYFPSDTPEWQEIQNYRLLRNCVIHNQGRLDDVRDPKALREYVSHKKSLSIRYDAVYLEKGFCEEACQTVEAFLRRLLS